MSKTIYVIDKVIFHDYRVRAVTKEMTSDYLIGVRVSQPGTVRINRHSDKFNFTGPVLWHLVRWQDMFSCGDVLDLTCTVIEL